MKARRNIRQESPKPREILTALLFLSPLLLGLILFFLIPITKSFLFSVSDVAATADGYQIQLRGFQSYFHALNRHTSYRQTVIKVVLNMLLQVPLIVGFSFFTASLMNQKFRGRTLFRIILFIPVITMMSMGLDNVLESQMSGFSSYKDAFAGAAVAFTSQIANYLKNMGINEGASNQIIAIADQIYDVIKLSGIQFLILLTGMQSIPASLYEAAKVEGGKQWEIFWKITFPMVSPLMVTCIVYTIVDSFTGSGNQVMDLIEVTAFTNLNFSLSAAMSWIYFLIVGVILVLVTGLVSRFVFYYDH